MRSSLCFASLFLTSLALAGNSAQTHHRVLVELQPGTSETVLKTLGTIAGQDTESGMIILELSRGLTLDQIGRAQGVRSALDEGAKHVNPGNLGSVDAYVAYLRVVARHGKKEESEEGRETAPSLDYWRAYQFFMQDRVDEEGNIRPDLFRQAQVQRDSMVPATVYSSGGLTQLPSLIAGKWSFVGPVNLDIPYTTYYGVRPLSGRINAIAYLPGSNSTYYVGTMGGVWKTTNSGVSWTALTDTMPYLSVSSIAIDPKNPKTIYVGTGDFPGYGPYSNGVEKSTDGGATWTAYGLSNFPEDAVSSVVIDPSNSNIVTVSTGRAYRRGLGGIYQSLNGGLTWSKKSVPLANWCRIDVSAPDTSGKRTYWAVGQVGGIDAATNPNGAAYVYRSTNSGASWTKATLPYAAKGYDAIDVACSKFDPKTVYVLVPDGASSHLYKTTDGGASWHDVLNSSFPGMAYGDNYNWSQQWYDFYLRTSTTVLNNVKQDSLFVGLITIAGSPDGGAHWADLGRTYTSKARTHNDQHSFAPSPGDPNTCLVGSDGGVFKMVFDPATKEAVFTSLNTHIGVTEFYKIAVDQQDTSLLIGGTQDNASPCAIDDLQNWSNPGAGDGGFAAIDPTDNSIQYNSSQDLEIYRTTDKWAGHPGTTEDITVDTSTGRNVFDEQGEGRQFIAPYTLADDHSILYAGAESLWVFKLGAWTSKLGGKILNKAGIRMVTVCPSDPNRIYTDDTTPGQLWMTKTAGTSWAEVGAGSSSANSLPPLPVIAISPNPTAANAVLVGLSRYTHVLQAHTSHLWHCANVTAPTSARVWQPVNGSGATGLPDLPVNAIARDPFDPGATWYVGTDAGVFMTRDAGAHWANMTNPLGLPNVQVNDLKVGAGNYLYAGTFGRGMWRIRLENPATLAVSSVSIAPTSVTGGTSSVLTINLNLPATYGGTVVSLKSSDAHATIASTATVKNGSKTATVTVKTTAVSVKTVVTLTATLNGASRSISLTINP